MIYRTLPQSWGGLEKRFGVRMVLDGEYPEPGGYLDTLRVIQSRGRREPRGTFHLLDAFPVAEWRADSCITALDERRAVIGRAWGDRASANVRRTKVYQPGSAAAVELLARAVWASGGEGLMLKRSDSVYQRTRSSTCQKLKCGASQ